MNTHPDLNSSGALPPGRIKEKADILETNLFKSISKQTDPSTLHIRIDRKNFPVDVINKALLHLFPRFNIRPRLYAMELKQLLQKDIPPDKPEKFEIDLDREPGYDDGGETVMADTTIASRRFEAIASNRELEIFIHGIPEVKTRHGEIVKSFFDHEQSPGQLLKGGIINFKEINKYPVVNSGDNLFFITHEVQGRPGLSYDSSIIPVEEARPYAISLGPGVKIVDARKETGESAGYFLQALKTGVVILQKNQNNRIVAIDISEEIEIKKLDYSTGNIGTRYTCPVQMKIKVICNGFKLRVHGRVEVMVVDGGEVITSNEAVITNAQPDSKVIALRDIRVDSANHAKLISERGTLVIGRELIDSEVSAPKTVFEKSRGLFTHNKVETEQLSFKGLYFSGENRIHFGNNLFVEKKELVTKRKSVEAEKRKLIETQDDHMTTLQVELKRLAGLAQKNPDLASRVKQVILATQTMDYETVFKEMDEIQKLNSTKAVLNVRKTFEALEKIPPGIRSCDLRIQTINETIGEVRRRINRMSLSIEGFLRPGASIRVFCGLPDDTQPVKPELLLDSDGSENQFIKVTGTYSPEKGFEFVG